MDFGISTWAGTTTVHPLGLSVLIACVIWVLFVKRHYAIIPLLLLIVAIPSAQRIVIISIDFSFLRILILVMLTRIFLKSENKELRFTRTDKLVILWMLWGIFAYGALETGLSGLISRSGYMLEAVGAYYIGRVYVRTPDDIKRIVIFLGTISIPIFVFFMIERVTGKNIFSVFGGVPDITLIREGRLRCQGPFSHPIMAGVFWASLLPLYASFWANKSISTWKLLIYVTSITLIVLNTASSTPIMSIFFGIIGLYLFKHRSLMPFIRWGAIFVLLSLHLVMTKPVWHLLARVNIIGGSTGWHRYHLIDKFFENIDEWWLLGTTSTAHWGAGLGDVTNQYVLEGVRGGVIGMVLFVLILASIFSLLGKKVKSKEDYRASLFYWSAGVMMFMHAMNFMATSYFGQMVAAFFVFAGIVVSLTDIQKKNPAV